MDGSTPYLQANLLVQNTSNQKFVVNSIAGNLWANDFLIGNLGYFVPQAIMANSQAIIHFSIRLSLIGIVTDILNTINSGGIEQKLDLKSYANVDNLQVPVNITYKIGG